SPKYWSRPIDNRRILPSNRCATTSFTVHKRATVGFSQSSGDREGSSSSKASFSGRNKCRRSTGLPISILILITKFNAITHTMVTFLGLGLVGSNFVKALIGKGEEVRVWNRTASKATALEQHGAKAFANIVDAVKGVDTIHLTLKDDGTVDEVLAAAA